MAERATPAIEAAALVRRFGAAEAVSGVSFDVHPGEFFGLLGPNGAGKTTTLQMLTTLLRPSSGQARVFGADTVLEAAAVRAQLGIVFQEPALDDRLSATENLAIHASLYRIPRRETQARVREALDWAALGEMGSGMVREFSGGMKRRLELARALMHRPRLLFLDEPTLGLDPQGRRNLWERIERLRGEGLTIFANTHYLQEAEACDRVAIMAGGRIVALGTPTELKEQVGGAGAASLEEAFLELTGRRALEEAPESPVTAAAGAHWDGENIR